MPSLPPLISSQLLSLQPMSPWLLLWTAGCGRDATGAQVFKDILTLCAWRYPLLSVVPILILSLIRVELTPQFGLDTCNWVCASRVCLHLSSDALSILRGEEEEKKIISGVRDFTGEKRRGYSDSCFILASSSLQKKSTVSI